MDLSRLEQQYGLPDGLLSRVMATESGGDPNAVSPKGAQGAFQFMPATARQYGVNPFDPASAAQGAARYLSDLHKQFGSWRDAVAAYNWGPGNLKKHGLDAAPAETRNYVAKVYGPMNSVSLADLPPPDKLQQPSQSVGLDALPPPDKLGYKAPPKEPAPTSAGGSWWGNVIGKIYNLANEGAFGLPNPIAATIGLLSPQTRAAQIAQIQDYGKGAALPYVNAASHIPGMGGVVAPVQKWAASASPKAQFLGGAVSTALPVAGVMGKIGAATETLPFATRALAQAAGGAGLGALTSNPGTETLGAVLGGAGGALATPGLLTRGLAAGPQTANDKALVEDALKAGYKLTPSYRTGVPGMLQAAAGPARTDAAQANNALLGQRLQQVLTNEPLNPRTLSGMGNKLMDEFDTATKGMTYTPKPAVAQFVSKRLPALKESLLDVAAAPGQDPTRLAQAKSLLGKLENGSPLDANETRQFLQTMKGIATDQEQFNRYVKPLLTVVEKDIQNTNPKLLSNIQSFNTRYNVYKMLQKSVESDPAFQARNQIDAERLAGAGAKYHSKEIDAANPDTLYGQLGLGRQLGLFPLRNPSERFPAAEAIGAFRQLQGGPGVGSEFGKFALARKMLESTVGRGLRAYYDSPAGQAALAGQRLPDSDLKSILALSALLNGQNALTAPQP